MRRPAAILTAAVLAGAIAGCGSSGPTKASFLKSFSAQKVRLRVLGDDVGGAVDGARDKTDDELETEFGGLAQRATALAGTLGQLNAPSSYRGDLLSLQSSVTQVAGTLRSIQAAAAAHDATAARAGGEAIVADAAQVKSYTDSLTARLGLPKSP